MHCSWVVLFGLMFLLCSAVAFDCVLSVWKLAERTLSFFEFHLRFRVRRCSLVLTGSFFGCGFWAFHLDYPPPPKKRKRLLKVLAQRFPLCQIGRMEGLGTSNRATLEASQVESRGVLDSQHKGPFKGREEGSGRVGH